MASAIARFDAHPARAPHCGDDRLFLQRPAAPRQIAPADEQERLVADPKHHGRARTRHSPEDRVELAPPAPVACTLPFAAIRTDRDSASQVPPRSTAAHAPPAKTTAPRPLAGEMPAATAASETRDRQARATDSDSAEKQVERAHDLEGMFLKRLDRFADLLPL